MIKISKELAEKLRFNILCMMKNYQASEDDYKYPGELSGYYQCEFCGEKIEASYWNPSIQHENKCHGVEMIAQLEKAISDSEPEEVCPDSH